MAFDLRSTRHTLLAIVGRQRELPAPDTLLEPVPIDVRGEPLERARKRLEAHDPRVRRLRRSEKREGAVVGAEIDDCLGVRRNGVLVPAEDHPGGRHLVEVAKLDLKTGVGTEVERVLCLAQSKVSPGRRPPVLHSSRALPQLRSPVEMDERG
jgi:hypothetical protein